MKTNKLFIPLLFLFSYYWQNATWNIVVWDAFDDKHGFDKPRYDYYKHLAGLFEKYNLNEFKPSFPKLTSNDKGGNDNLATKGYGLYDEKGNYLMMIPKESERVNVVIPKPENGKVNVTWFNPFSGEYLNQGTKEWSGWLEMVSPWQYEMSVLIIE